MQEFFDKYTGDPAFNTDNEEGQEGRMETFRPHVTRVIEQFKIKPQTVWTVVEGDDGELYVVAGFHIVNRFLYIVTLEEWTDINEEYIF